MKIEVNVDQLFGVVVFFLQSINALGGVEMTSDLLQFSYSWGLQCMEIYPPKSN